MGSRKSSLALSLLCMIEASTGRIIYVIISVLLLVTVSKHVGSIDKIDISTIGLEDLRSQIVDRYHIWPFMKLLTCSQTIVSQDVLLFSSTLRSNLDAFKEYTDQECWDVLKRCHLTRLLSQAIEKGGLTIEVPISQGGLLSAGERQLIALARAVLQKTNIIIMDEAMTEIYWCLDDQVSWHITPVLRLTGIHCWRLDLGAFLLG